jgi:hypothetical protein
MKPRSIFRCRTRGSYPGEVIRRGASLTPGTVTIAEVMHDTDCRRPQGMPCTCEPEVRFRPLDDPERN